MKVSHLIHLIEPWKLADIDTGSDTLAFQPYERGVIASFEGNHVGAMRWSTEVAIEGLTHMIAVSWRLLDGALGLFDENSECTARLSDAHLFLESGARKTRVRLSSDIAPFSAASQFEAQVEIDMADMPTFVPLLSSVAARTIEKPVLTGINLSISESGELLLRATDVSRAFAAAIPARRIVPPFEITIQAADLVAAFNVLKGVVSIKVEGDGKMALMRDADTVLRVSSLFGTYPSFATLPRDGFAFEFDLPSEVIKLANRAANLLDQNRLMTVTISGGVLAVSVAGEVFGDFRMELDPVQGIPDFSLSFDAEYFAVAAELASNVTVSVVDPRRPVRVQGGKGRDYWVSPTIRV